MQNWRATQLFLTNNLARGLAQETGCNNLLFHAVRARPRASLHALESSSNVSHRVSLSLLFQHTALGDQLGQFSLKTSLKRPLLRQHQQHRHKDLFVVVRTLCN